MEQCPNYRELFFMEGGEVRVDVSDEMVARAVRSLCHSQCMADLEADLCKAASEEEARAVRSRASRSLSGFLGAQ